MAKKEFEEKVRTMDFCDAIAKIVQLEAQIAKMRNFHNCDYQLHVKDCPIFKSGRHLSCKNCPYWILQKGVDTLNKLDESFLKRFTSGRRAVVSRFPLVEKEQSTEEVTDELKRFLALWENTVREIREANKAVDNNARITHLCDNLESSMVAYAKGDIEYAHFVI